jgi:tetratricopeptide (TPR) repeat protein
MTKKKKIPPARADLQSVRNSKELKIFFNPSPPRDCIACKIINSNKNQNKETSTKNQKNKVTMKKTRPVLLLLLTLIAVAAQAQNPKSEELSKLYNTGEFEQAIEKAHEYLQDDPQNMDYTAVLGRALVDKGQFAEAIEPLKYVAENDNSWRKAWLAGYLGTAYLMLSDAENVKVMRRAIKYH